MSKFLFLIILLFSISPFFIFAQLDYPYHAVPGTTITVTEESTIGEVVNYLARWVIIIGALIAFLVLIHAGFIYLTSSFGDPEKVREAKTKIFNALLGLAILIGSYVILLLINPQFMVLRLEKTPIDEGIVLLTEDGHIALQNNTATIEEIVMQGNAVYFSNSKNLRKYPLWGAKKRVFGDLTVQGWQKTQVPNTPEGTSTKCEPTELNFKNFKLTHLAFLPKTQKDIKILLHSNADFKPEPGFIYSPGQGEKMIEYIPEGKLNADGKVVADSKTKTINEMTIKINEIEVSDFTTGVKYNYMLPPDCDSGASLPLPSIVPHPPLSLVQKPYGPGVYLYGDTIGEEMGPLKKTTSGDFSFKDYWFNNKTVKIELKNEQKKHDFIAVLYEDENYSGNLRIVFEKVKGNERGLSSSIVGAGENPCMGDLSCGNYLTPDLFDTSEPSPRQNPPLTSSSNQYGKVSLEKKISSIQVREIDDPSVCKRVWLCTEPMTAAAYGAAGGGECLVYVKIGDPLAAISDLDRNLNIELRKYPDVWIVAAVAGWMPFFSPVDLTSSNLITLRKYNSKEEKVDTKEITVKNIFYRNIHSLKIEGSNKGTCMVVLYQLPTTDANFPGGNSEVFFNSVPNLEGHRINKCRTFRGFLWTIDNPCASAIAVFPVKK